MGGVLPMPFAKFARISFLNRNNGENHQVIRMQLKSENTVSNEEIGQIKNFCQDKLNPEAELNINQVGSTLILGISNFQEERITLLRELIKK